jgi:addiction module RelE/StbE family toxin
MARKIIWSPTAVADLDDIFAYISRDSAHYAAGAIEKILDSADALLQFPRMGRVVPEFNDDKIRELIVYRYRVIYRVESDAINIATVVHGARLLKNALRGHPTLSGAKFFCNMYIFFSEIGRFVAKHC